MYIDDRAKRGTKSLTLSAVPAKLFEPQPQSQTTMKLFQSNMRMHWVHSRLSLLAQPQQDMTQRVENQHVCIQLEAIHTCKPY